MSPKNIQIDRRMTSTIFVLTILVVVVGCSGPASAQWRAVDAQNAWSGYQNAFLKLEPDNYSKVFVKKQGDTASSWEYMWQQAEEIEVAEDAYYENPTTANKNTVQALCDGFVNYVFPQTGDNWSSDTYNDDLGVAIIAFIRAYNITGTTRWLTDAENNFNVVWNRAQAGDGGLCEQTKSGVGCYENSSANWTFVIAGNLIYNATGISSYKTEKDGVYTWAKANLYNSSTGEIYDAKGGVSGQYTYNYGYAMIAGTYQGSNVMVPKIATYVFNNLTNYDGTAGGYNLMPDYSNGETVLNGAQNGFNGILMRGVAIANKSGYIPSAVLLAAQANMNQAWSERNGTTTLVWDDWDAATQSTGTYSWNDSSALAGLLDIPPTA
jgi:hypothetical protein